MSIFKYILVMMLLLPYIGGCAGNSVDIIQVNYFNALSKNMEHEFLNRNIIESDRTWLNVDYFEDKTNYGNIIFQKLSPSIIFENDVTLKKYPNFASSISAADLVKIRKNSFKISSPTKTITTNMVAKADWNLDGKTDWIISCFVQTKLNPRTRDYTIVILDPDNSFSAYVVGVKECIGSDCEQYQIYDIKTTTNNTHANCTHNSKTIDTLPGLKNITSPPPTVTKKINYYIINKNNVNEKELPK